jgi:hypothetical protein
MIQPNIAEIARDIFICLSNKRLAHFWVLYTALFRTCSKGGLGGVEDTPPPFSADERIGNTAEWV